jgi:hypothetical protein
MKKIISSIFLLLSVTIYAQTEDVVATAGGVNDVYYDFETQSKTAVARSTWDIGLTTDPQGASIIINENGGVEVYLYGADTSAWSTLDTAGMKWTKIYNSETTWASGAFANQGTNHPDYGWGVYNSTTHDIVGNRIFILKNTLGELWKVMVPAMKANGDFAVRMAKVDGSSEMTYTFNKMDFKDKNFHLITVNDASAPISTNPNKKDWDMLFTKYITFVQAGPNSRYQPVAGVKVNVGCEVAQRDGIAIDSDDTTSLSWNSTITEIGWDWKTFDMASTSYIMVPDRTYFIRTANGAVWKLWFTDFTVGTSNSTFNTKLIKESASSKNMVQLKTQVYPNPASNALTIRNNENESLKATLMNAQGAIILTDNLSAFTAKTIPTSDFAKGIYFLQLSTSTTSNTQRVIFE